MTDNSADDQGEQRTPHESGKWLGEFEGLMLRTPVDGEEHNPVLEIHGEEAMAAVEVGEQSVDGFTEAAAEISVALEDDRP
jgi:hypothetical protein